MADPKLDATGAIDATSPSTMILNHGYNEVTNQEQIQAALEELQARLAVLKSPPASPPSSFLKKLPRELRNEIYKLVLVKPVLDDPEAINPRHEFGSSKKYELSPGLLRTCSQVHEEASPILYEKNTFIFCALGCSSESLNCLSFVSMPLTRHLLRRADPDNPVELNEIPGFTKIRQWNIIVSPWVGSPASFHSGLLPYGANGSIESWRGNLYVHGPTPVVNPHRYRFLNVLAPLKLFRNLEKLDFSFTAAPDRQFRSTPESRSRALQTVSQMKALAALTESNTVIDYVFDMYNNVLAYARTFERDQSFQEEMVTSKHAWREDTNMPTPINAMCTDKTRLAALNPFKTKDGHPVEHALELAKYASDENDYDAFKMQRKNMLNYLEPQYQRFMAASDFLTAFVKEQKRDSGVLGTSTLNPKDDGEYIKQIIEGTLLLEAYAKAFMRDLSPEVWMIVHLHQDKFDDHYDDLQRERYLAEMCKAIKTGCWDQWRKSFRRAADDMDEQYMQIREARKKLFDFDRSDAEHGCDVNVERWRFDERIVWHVDEPDLGPWPEEA